MNALHPDTGRVLDADAAHPSPLRLTNDEADAVAIEADILDGKHGGGFYAWVHDLLRDIRCGVRGRDGRRK